MSTNPHSKLLNAYPHTCYTLGPISSSNLDNATPSFWISKETLPPCHNWNMQKKLMFGIQQHDRVLIITIPPG